MSTAAETATDIRPFQVEIPEEELADLRRRIEATRWPSKEPVKDRSQGVGGAGALLARAASDIRFASLKRDRHGRSSTPEGAGSFSSAPNLPAGLGRGWHRRSTDRGDVMSQPREAMHAGPGGSGHR